MRLPAPARRRADAFPRAFALAHTGSGERYDFIILACRRLYQASGGTVACNFRRAAIGDLSMDGLSVENPANGRFYFADIISGAGGSNPILYYDGHPFHDGALLRDRSGRYAPWGAANPFGVPGSYGPIRTAVNYGRRGRLVKKSDGGRSCDDLSPFFRYDVATLRESAFISVHQ